MTVCIASIYNNNAVLGASDRMVTGGFGDITFEPSTPKILPFTNSIAVLTAGDQNIQMQVFQETSKIVTQKIIDDQDRWLDVSEVANIYSKNFYTLKNKIMENILLSKYNLTLDTFISKQKEMSESFIEMISRNINRFDIEHMQRRSIETIITGIDDSGPHIFVITDGQINCNDKLGFASIGIGANHAISHFMTAKYSRSDSESKALLTIHQAKKKSEVSLGVGKETDMCVIGPLKGTFKMLLPLGNGKDIVKDLDDFYKKYTRGIMKLNAHAEKNIQKYLSLLTSPSQSKQKTNPSLPLSTSKSKKPKKKNIADKPKKTFKENK